MTESKKTQGYFKICLIGAPLTGKTSFFNRTHLPINYAPTVSVHTKSFPLPTNYGQYDLMIWDLPGHLNCQKQDYYLESSAALAFYTESTIEQTNQLITNFRKVCPDVPIFNIWSFSDLSMIPDKITCSQGGRPTYQTSSLVVTDDDTLWIDLLRLLTKNDDLHLLMANFEEVD